MFQYHCLNPIAEKGLKLFGDNYKKTETADQCDAILVRSAKMHDMELPKSVCAVARAGAGVNNIPVKEYAEKGVVVFNTPGANANGVKELVLAGMLEHTCKYQLFYAICVSSRRVEYNNALLCILLNRNIIDACTCTCNCANALRQLHVVHFCTSYKDCVTLVSGLCFFIIIAKKFQTFFSDRIQAMILEHYAFSSSNFFMNATRASTPAFGMAL